MAATLTVPHPPAGLVSEAAWQEAGWQEAGWLPCRLQAEISVCGFTVGDLMNLQIGAIVNSGVAIESDVCVRVNRARVGRARLEPAGNRLALRLTELV